MAVDDAEDPGPEPTPPGGHEPLKQKLKGKKAVWLGIALSALGIVVAIVLAKRSKQNTADATAANGYTYPNVGGDPTGADQSGTVSQLGLGLDNLFNAQQQSDAANQSAMAALSDGFTSQLSQLAATVTAQGASLSTLGQLPASGGSTPTPKTLPAAVWTQAPQGMVGPTQSDFLSWTAVAANPSLRNFSSTGSGEGVVRR